MPKEKSSSSFSNTPTYPVPGVPPWSIVVHRYSDHDEKKPFYPFYDENEPNRPYLAEDLFPLHDAWKRAWDRLDCVSPVCTQVAGVGCVACAE